jgi:hypothetical protein
MQGTTMTERPVYSTLWPPCPLANAVVGRKTLPTLGTKTKKVDHQYVYLYMGLIQQTCMTKTLKT